MKDKNYGIAQLQRFTVENRPLVMTATPEHHGHYNRPSHYDRGAQTLCIKVEFKKMYETFK